MSDSTASPYLVDLIGLAGKTAVVVGGTGTLGGAIADALAGAGAHILITGRNAEHVAASVTRLVVLRKAHGTGVLVL